jgi:hypothetical protein
MPVSILEDPDGLGDELSITISRFAFKEPSSLAWTRHNSLIFLIASNVV